MFKWLLCVSLAFCVNNAEKPCAARPVKDQSVVCVCNATYCDEVEREQPEEDTYFTYTTSERGARFAKAKGYLKPQNDSYAYYLRLNAEFQYQIIEGFGGAVTDSAAINWKSLSEPLQQHLISSYFGDKGLEYNMLRVPIGGTDFSVRGYAYNEYPVNDTHLTNFTLAEEDIKYKIPMIKQIFNATTTPVYIVATTWSPPTWMKSNNNFLGHSHLLKKYYQTYADYHVKFLQSYADAGIPVWGITTTNEPTNGVLFSSPINCLGWTPSEMGDWIESNLGPTIRNSKFKDVKIIAVDDQRYIIPLMFNLLLKYHPGAYQYLDGVAVHYYSDFFTPTSILDEVARDHPDKFVIATEACEGSFPWEINVELGSWKRAVTYVRDIISDMNNNLIGWIDWNLCLNKEGGPNWVKNFVDSPIIVFPEKDEFVKQPMFYAMGHFSKFVPRGSSRVSTTERCPHDRFCSFGIENAAFATPRGTVVAVLYNAGKKKELCVAIGEKQLVLMLDAHSITTVEIAYNSTALYLS